LGSKELLDNVKQAVVNYDSQSAVSTSEAAIKSGVDPLDVLDKATEGVKVVGDRFQRFEAFLPQLVMAADAMIAVEKIVEKNLSKERRVREKKRVVLGTVHGDLHDIGKNIVFALLSAAGFDVTDIGKDAPVEKFIEEAKGMNADIIGASALMTVTIEGQRELIDELERLRLRDRFKVIVGGGSVTEDWVKEIRADGYGKDAKQGVEVALKLIGREV